jgi:hypothetical protein
MPDNTPLDDMLLPLADAYEVRRNRAVLVEVRSVEEWEPLREFLAQQFADGLMTYWGTGRPTWNVAFTDKGYSTYLPRIRATRALA